MEFAGFRFRFSATDFAQRVQDAAVRLGFVPRAHLPREDLEDLVSLAAHGEIGAKRASAKSTLANRPGLFSKNTEICLVVCT